MKMDRKIGKEKRGDACRKFTEKEDMGKRGNWMSQESDYEIDWRGRLLLRKVKGTSRFRIEIGDCILVLVCKYHTHEIDSAYEIKEAKEDP